MDDNKINYLREYSPSASGSILVCLWISILVCLWMTCGQIANLWTLNSTKPLILLVTPTGLEPVFSP